MRQEPKTSVTTVKMTPEVRSLWERCAEAEHRSLTNLLEVAVRDYAKKLGIEPVSAPAVKTAKKN
jgi:predicted transcriptional regulator